MKECIEDGISISLLIAEHSRMGCQLMEAALQSYPRISVAASIVESAEILEVFDSARPDICVISSSLKDGPTGGFCVARELPANFRHPKSIILLASSARHLVIEASPSASFPTFSL